jgi:OOP family OmpA-OmpF porin
MIRIVLSSLLAFSMALSIGCATKKYVHNQVTPLIDKVNALDEQTAKNSHDIADVGTRVQQSIPELNAKIDETDQKATAAGRRADEAQQVAARASGQLQSLSEAIANRDSYRTLVETSVHFGPNQNRLTPQAKRALDELAAEIAKTKSYILTVKGGADAAGSKDFNYALSQRRAESVIAYLSSQYHVPVYKVYSIGLGEDKPVAANTTPSGRAKNRRVDIELMTNTGGEHPASAAMQQPGEQNR